MATSQQQQQQQQQPITNHAVIVSASRYWFNYRHVVNALSFYQLCKSNGIPDENIVLMLADDLPSNARNPYKNGMYANGVHPDKTLFDSSAQIDYRGEDATVDNLVKVLLGRQGEHSPQLNTDENSNILIYLTGHGGDQFFKFQDIEEITSEEIANVLDELHRRKRYNKVLLVADTCQAFTLGDHITAPNVMVIGSSLKGESSYAHHSDSKLGLSVIERYTHQFLTFVQKQGMQAAGNMTIPEAMVDPYPYVQQRAHVGFKHTMASEQEVNATKLSEFFVNHALPKACHLASNTTADPIPSWPLPIGSHNSRRSVHKTSRRLVTQGSGLEGTLESVLPLYEPTDGPFVAIVLVLMSFVFLLSRNK